MGAAFLGGGGMLDGGWVALDAILDDDGGGTLRASDGSQEIARMGMRKYEKKR